ncbi:methanogenic corrinoid protein MtbC1 [Desulfitobacterium sp. LBE]|uniref:Cobalamin-binding protein n=5 Tax=root TaxID=1 RepID=Q24R07_DESHY|nr:MULTISPECIES: cobalamin-dependent protein [Desulfitobacterium]ACL19652.1 cobalamin B12-binding domain protein [Desulfitobacterium hafniense DCB-2]EHL08356.1 B12 binding domain protein [Desulfitobacterium hafniense DP7]KTE89660.1 cobalamin-binding protein [Desulfitobacterium hafniense]MEA5024487.1 cobalamin-dependent protein [Desulfitobacterium hafniense]TWH57496.1 methanogenic corrinoid protein MtbC1 [Desulfitobacterium sp. LBE]
MDLKALTQALGNLDGESMEKMLNEFVTSEPGEAEVNSVVGACQQGMAIVGDLFGKNEYFVGDLIYAGELLNNALGILKPVIGEASTEKIGKMVLGTVEGDLHDIGKNIFRGMMEAAGFEVYDLGIDIPAGVFVEKVKEIKPQIVGMSGLLTLTLGAMKATVDALTAAGVRDGIKIILGGSPVTEDACRHIGADAFTVNAAEGVKICQEWVK